MDLHGKVALITGAKGGLGSHVTQAFLASGAKVVGVSRSIQDSDFLHENFRAFPAELSTESAAAGVVRHVHTEHGRLDALVHLMGGFAGGHDLSETTVEEMESMFSVNFLPAFHLVRSALRVMREQGSGRIMAVGSRTVVEPQPGLAAYSASKAALVSMLQTAARENSLHGVSVNVVLPGTMDTPANRKSNPSADHSKWVQPSVVAELLVYLSSDCAAQVTGALIPVYGGEL